MQVLEENTRQTYMQSIIRHESKNMATKEAKIKPSCIKGHYKSEKTTHKTGQNICKSYIC